MNARAVLVIAVTKINNEAMKKLPLAVVIIPTYNEADSIGKMIEQKTGNVRSLSSMTPHQTVPTK